MLQKFIRDDSAATAIEYGLIAMILSLAIIAGASGISDYIQDSYQNTAAKVQEVTAASPK